MSDKMKSDLEAALAEVRDDWCGTPSDSQIMDRIWPIIEASQPQLDTLRAQVKVLREGLEIIASITDADKGWVKMIECCTEQAKKTLAKADSIGGSDGS